MNKFVACAMLVLVTGCVSERGAEPLDVPNQAIDIAEHEAEHDPLFTPTKWIEDDWWTLFGDDQLSDFIQRAFARSPTLQTAKANILLAASNANKARAVLFPNLTWGADVSRQKLSKTGVIPFTSNPTSTKIAVPFPQNNQIGIPVYFTLEETELTLLYDFDIWNKNRNTWIAALDEIQSKIADEAFTHLQLGISVAQAYFQLQIGYKRQAILRALLKNKNEYLEYIQKRLKGNIQTNIDRNNAEINLTQVRDELYQVENNVIVAEYQLKTYLAGDFTEIIEHTKVVEKPLPKVPLPKEIPLHLIAHRPDIISQIWLIESAGWQIEVAKAGFYPDFNIAALFGFQTIHWHDFFKWPSSYFNVDPAVTLPIFDGGRLRANLSYSEVNYDLAILEYNNRILNATKEVLAGIALLRNTNQQLLALKQITQSNENNVRLANLRLKHNLDSRLDFLIAEGNELNAQDQEAQALGNTYQAILSLFKALGGGYEACYEEG